VFAPMFPWLEGPLLDVVRRRVLSTPWAALTVRPSTLGRGAAVVGAAHAPLGEVFADPLGAAASIGAGSVTA
jgi:hypothetical protein